MPFADHVLAFSRALRIPDIPLPEGFSWLFPYEQPETQRVMALFYQKYYADSQPRFFLFGINPGRFGAGITGIPFTDPVRLSEDCGIPNAFPQKQELSAQFIWQVIRALGGPERFFHYFYITALSPLGFVRRGVNVNYYDDRQLLQAVEPFLIWNIRTQMAFGAHREAALCIGEGQNFRVFQRLNAEHGFLERITALPHPRWVMQYRRKCADTYVAQYAQTLQSLLPP
ncbi:MAG: DUF4918 family protein [Saprospiraceae bacterium]|nr:DUF4918 family protein [Saprospiraceae bacterium]MDW8229504.1 DUF4918 family protein [Saprospiraceae bacterium]